MPQSSASKLLRFLGPKVRLVLLGSLLTGVSLALIEYAFAFSLQLFLYGIGVMPRETLAVPGWLAERVPSQLWQILLVVSGLAFLRGAFFGMQNWLRGSAEDEFRYLQRSRLLNWVFLSDSSSSSLVVRLFTEITSSSGSMLLAAQTLIVRGTICLFLLASLFLVSPMLTAIFLGLGILVALPTRWLYARIRHHGRLLVEQLGITNSRLLMGIKNLLLIQIHGTQAQEEQSAQRSLARYHGHMMSYHRASSVLVALPQVMGIGIACFIAYLAKERFAIAPGLLVVYFYLLIRVVETLAVLSQEGSRIQLLAPQFRTLARWWADHAHDGARKPRPREALAPAAPSIAPLGWELDRVSFSFGEGHAELFRDLSLRVPPGSALAITGGSGAGKSTLVSILIGSLSPTSGEVRVALDGGSALPLEKTKARLYPSIGYVGAESFLVDGSIRENLFYGLRSEPSETEIWSALKQAECEFVRALPAGLEHRLTEQGQGLSAGQKQRLGLARALLRDPKALILDEATANLDVETEAKLVETLSGLKSRMTLIIVTHRQAPLRLADQQVRVGGESQA